jgi:CheY-like chemotaxis protein
LHGFAHQSGGTARIESAPGEGTEIMLLLPRTGGAVRDTGVRGDDTEPEDGHCETVLVVEDDALVRTALAETLRDLRYRVVEAADADAALASLDAGARVDAVLTDLTMPGSMDGLGLAAAARARLPAVPVVLISGHLDASQGKPLPPGVEFVQKPHTGGAIAAALRRALGGAAVLARP